MRLASLITASLFATFATAVLIQLATVHLGMEAPGEFALAVPTMAILLLLVGLNAAARHLLGRSLLTRPELICVCFSMLLAAPLMTQGFWHRVVSITSTIPRESDFRKLDALSDRLWPHGPNILHQRFTQGHRDLVGDGRWETVANGSSRNIQALVLENQDPATTVSARITLPVGGPTGVVPGEPYLISILLRPHGLGADSACFGRIFGDDPTQSTNIFMSQAPGRITPIQPGGFLRTGLYGVPVPSANHTVTLELGLRGVGRVEFADPKMQNVKALEGLFSGVNTVTATEYQNLGPEERASALIRPDHLLSPEGLLWYLCGYIPWADWVGPIAAWGGLVVLILVGTLCLNVLFRKKWLESERYDLPLTRIPLALISDGQAPIWRNRIFLAGLAISLFWGLMKGWNFYNPAVPNLNIEIPLAPYFGVSSMWDGVTFRVLAILVAVAVFIELNILLSIVVGFLLFRATFLLGEIAALNVYPGYPFAQEQQIASFLSYAALTLLVSRKYLGQVLRQILRGGQREEGEVMAYRTALYGICAVLVASLAWAAWVGVSPGGMFCFMLFLLLVGFVAAKLRAEAGVPFGYFTPNNAALVLLLLGGLSTFGPQMLLLAFMSSFFISVAAFFLIPGAQLELLEIGRRERIPPHFLLVTIAMGLTGGILLGGWVFLSNAYALGGDSLRYSWAFTHKAWYFNDYDLLLSQAAGSSLAEQPARPGTGLAPSTWAYLFGVAGTGALVLLRQFFAGFWFHPVGFLLGPSHMLGYVWGSFLVAWVLRLVFVKIGGAEAVRTRLQPFFVGAFAGAVIAMSWWGIYGWWIASQGATLIYGSPP